MTILDRDATLKDKVENLISVDPRIDGKGMAVSVKDGIVRLDGTVSGFRSKRAVEDISVMVPGVVAVDNRLSVIYPVEPFPEQEEIAQGVHNMLKWDPDVRASDIRIEAKGTEVRLSGTVATLWEKILAEDDARTVGGVTHIQNDIEVAPSESVIDEQIRADIEGAYMANAFVNDMDVQVRIEHGNVRLEGEVPSWTAKREAYDIACWTPGVRNVEDRVAVAQ